MIRAMFGIGILRVGERVRVVRMDGCMAHVRNNPREGVVISINKDQIYGWEGIGYPDYMYAEIKLDSGEIIKRCAARKFWTVNEGLPEYQE